MSPELYERYQAYSKKQLFDILINKEDYQPDAVKAAERVVKENNWEEDFAELINELEQEYQAGIEEKAAYYKKAVEFKKDRISFEIKPSDIPKFEATLIKHDIEFFREDKYVGTQLDSYPTERYYFKKEDSKTVDKICIDLKLITLPHVDVKPFWSMELKVTIIVILVFLLALLAIL